MTKTIDHSLTSFLQLVICTAICGAGGYRISLLPNTWMEDFASTMVWIVGATAIVGGIALSTQSGDDDRLASKFAFWSGVALITGHLIGAWP